MLDVSSVVYQSIVSVSTIRLLGISAAVLEQRSILTHLTYTQLCTCCSPVTTLCLGFNVVYRRYAFHWAPSGFVSVLFIVGGQFVRYSFL